MTDAQIRQQALDPAQSFIIQAPAGSGKTELLTQRYLSLLSQACEAPEEIVAITFTRKAAAQMRERVLGALQLAELAEPSEPHRLITWRLAKPVLEKDQRLHWGLLTNPHRLRILTIDSLCAQLSSRLPLLSGYGGSLRLVEDARPYYQQAVREFILDAIPTELLAHLDNNAEYLCQLCVELLANREQWLPYIVFEQSSTQLRQQMQHSLERLAQDILTAAFPQFSAHLQNRLFSLLRFAGEQLHSKQPTHLLVAWRHRQQFPTPHCHELNAWRGLAQALLTNTGEWRKMVDIRNGFPPKTAEKAAFEEILAALSDQEIIKHHLQQIQACPPVVYSDDQWRIMTILIASLPHLVARLQLLFQQQGVMDFIEMGLGASRALGEPEEPTDLALALDYQMRHLLVDEFQDTSVTQFKLLEKLLWGWEPQDGRSIFLVGDPMQSIYRFRNAEVGLFLRTAHYGMQNIRLIPLQLTTNFRSGEQLIHWFNQIFPSVLAPENDLTTGAIAYTPSLSAQTQTVLPAINCYRAYDLTQQGTLVARIIQQCQQQFPNDTIAVLVRSRSHLREIIPAIHACQIKFQAVEIEPLAHCPEIQDLAALTRALNHRADRISWLAVLRAPYCGLALADLHVLAQDSKERTLYESLLRFSQLSELSTDAKLRLQRVGAALSQAFSDCGRLPLAEWIENTWIALGGPAVLTRPLELTNVETYFKLLNQLTPTEIFNTQSLDDKLAKLFAAPDMEAHSNLQIMTIHKAKGLEFDHVILPGLHHLPNKDDSKLFLWMERAGSSLGSDLILAPIKEKTADSDPIYTYLKNSEQQKLRYEAARLLYVAATRAKQALHLFAVIPSVPDLPAWQPPPASFLQMLWPYFREQIANDMPTAMESPSPLSTANQTLLRLRADWPGAEIPPFEKGRLGGIFKKIPLNPPVSKGEAVWIGTVVHESLAALATQAPNFQNILAANPYREKRLRQLGMPAADVSAASLQIRQILENMLQDPRGLWILSAEHSERRNEYALSAMINGEISHVILDRTFIDEHGVRWIIDYKTGDSIESNLPAYVDQLTRYAEILSLREPRPIRLGLYFLQSCTWKEWPAPLISARSQISLD